MGLPAPSSRTSEGAGASSLAIPPSLLADAPQVRLALDEDPALRHRGGRVVGTVAEVVSGENFELGPGLDHVAPVGAGEVDAPVGRGDGASARRDPGQPLLVQQLAARHFPAPEDVVVTRPVEILADHDARAACRGLELGLPLDVRLADVTRPG